MPRTSLRAVALLMLAQVGLVGACGDGLHGLLGCEHGAASCCADEEREGEHHDCLFCAQQRESRPGDSTTTASDAAIEAYCGCDGCAVCDLLSQYHEAVPFAAPPLAMELFAGERGVEMHNAVVAAAVRFALSRGPPAA